jgi:hypothetical protein
MLVCRIRSMYRINLFLFLLFFACGQLTSIDTKPAVLAIDVEGDFQNDSTLPNSFGTHEIILKLFDPLDRLLDEDKISGSIAPVLFYPIYSNTSFYLKRQVIVCA